jgi:hypothetical protein
LTCSIAGSDTTTLARGDLDKGLDLFFKLLRSQDNPEEAHAAAAAGRLDRLILESLEQGPVHGFGAGVLRHARVARKKVRTLSDFPWPQVTARQRHGGGHGTARE